MKKHLFIFLFMGLFSATLSSCSSSQTFTVQGIPGTVITNPSNKQLAVIDHSGQAKIKLKRKEGYYHYLQAQAPGSYLQVPFALDYKDRKGTIGKVGCGLGLLSSTALIVEALTISDDKSDKSLGIVALGTGAMAVLGYSMALADMPGDENRVYNYQKKQITNNDIIR